MENYTIKFDVPKGYKYSKELSTNNEIVCIQEAELFPDIARKLFVGKESYYCTNRGTIETIYQTSVQESTYGLLGVNNMQCEKLFSINRLLTVSYYLNEGWEPDWSNKNEDKYFIYINSEGDISIGVTKILNGCIAYFQTKEIAALAIETLGDRTIRKALSSRFLSKK